MLLQMLKAEQEARGLKDRGFAELLGVSRVTWTMTRLGHKPMGPTIARAARKTFPNLEREASIFLLEGVTESTKTVTIDTDRDLVEAAG